VFSPNKTVTPLAFYINLFKSFNTKQMEQNKHRVCPWWIGYLLLFPLRKISNNPYKILGPHIKEGMNILDYGCAMGYFSLPLAHMTGVKGIVYCIDIQQKMLEKLQKRADKAGLAQIIKTRLVGKTYDTDELLSQIDFVMLFFVAHEVSDQENLFKDLFKMVKPGGKVLFAEPKGHVTPDDFENSLQVAKSAGFMVSEEKPIPMGLSAFLLK